MKLEKDKNLLKAILAIVVVAIYPVAFLYLNNIDEINIAQTLIPLSISLLVGVVLFSISWWIIKDSNKATIISSLFFMLIINYSFVEEIVRKIFHQLRYWHILPILIVVLLHVCYFLNKKMSKDTSGKFAGVITIIFAGLILINIITAIPNIIKKINNTSVVSKRNDTEVNNTKNGNSPNIYYIIMDEYSNFNVLKKYYGYDNATFKNFLEDRKFNISLDSKNEAYSTHIVTTNYINLDYVVNIIDQVSPYRTNPYLFELLENNGYSIKYLSEVPISWKDSIAIKPQGNTVGGDTFKTVFLKNTIYYPFIKNSNNNIYRQKFERGLEFLKSSFEGEDASSFTYIHFLAPHVPFIYGQNGEVVPTSEMQNTVDKSYYLNQLIYVTKQISDTLDEILDKDPHSVIILQSDHSMRYIGGPIGGEGEAQYSDKVSILNAVYYKGKTFDDIKGQSGVNTLRIVLNNLLNLDMEILEVPSYDK